MILNKELFCKLAVEKRLKVQIPMSKVNDMFGLIYYKSSSDKQDYVECTIEPYKFF